jgi:hypothetical protein
MIAQSASSFHTNFIIQVRHRTVSFERGLSQTSCESKLEWRVHAETAADSACISVVKHFPSTDKSTTLMPTKDAVSTSLRMRSTCSRVAIGGGYVAA